MILVSNKTDSTFWYPFCCMWKWIDEIGIEIVWKSVAVGTRSIRKLFIAFKNVAAPNRLSSFSWKVTWKSPLYANVLSTATLLSASDVSSCICAPNTTSAQRSECDREVDERQWDSMSPEDKASKNLHDTPTRRWHSDHSASLYCNGEMHFLHPSQDITNKISQLLQCHQYLIQARTALIPNRPLPVL